MTFFWLKHANFFVYAIDVINWFMLNLGYFLDCFCIFYFFGKCKELVHINWNIANSDWNNRIFLVEAWVSIVVWIWQRNFSLFEEICEISNFIQINFSKQMKKWKRTMPSANRAMPSVLSGHSANLVFAECQIGALGKDSNT